MKIRQLIDRIFHSDLRHEFDRVSREHSRLTAENASLRTLVESFQEENEEYSSRIRRAIADREAAEKLGRALQRTNDQLSSAMLELNAKHAELFEQLGNVENAKQAEVTELRRQLSHERERLEFARASYLEEKKALLGSIDFLEQRAKDLKRDNDSLGVRLIQAAQIEEKNLHLKARIEAQAQRINELEVEVEEKSRELDRWLSLGYDLKTVDRAVEQQLVLEGAAGEPAKVKRIDFNRSTMERAIAISRVWLDKENTWSFHDGSTEIAAKIVDKDFLGKIARREVTFGHGDVLQCVIEVDSWRDEDAKLHSSYRITRVVEVIPPTEQTNFITNPPVAFASGTTTEQ